MEQGLPEDQGTEPKQERSGELQPSPRKRRNAQRSVCVVRRIVAIHTRISEYRVPHIFQKLEMFVFVFCGGRHV